MRIARVLLITGAACAVAAPTAVAAGLLAPPAYTPPNAAITKGLPASCGELVNGTSGDAAPKGSTPPVRTGPAVLPVGTSTLAALPTRVDLRTTSQSFNDRYDIAVRGGHLYIRGRADGNPTHPWQQLVLPPCLEGRVTAGSIDGGVLNVTDARGNVYTSTVADQPLDSIYASWTRRWGPPFWGGPGVRIPPGTVAWSASNSTKEHDAWYIDGAGNRAPIIGIDNVYSLGKDGRIVLNDPWLASDESVQSCAPQNGRFHADTLSASASTMFVGGPDGSLYTRMFDFDTSGGDIVQLKYAWASQRGVADPVAQLPAPGWVRQPTVPGRTTNVLSISTTGVGSPSRRLRVEGLDRQGQVGSWTKMIDARRWSFVKTGGPLIGTLRRPGAKPLAPPPSQAYDYATTLPDGTKVQALGIDPYCSPGTLRLTAKSGQHVDLVLHSVDGLRQLSIPAGWYDFQREKYGAIEVPKAVLARRSRLAAPLRTIVDGILAKADAPAGVDGGRLTRTNLDGTRGSLWIDAQCWKLRRTGAKVPAGTNPAPDGCPAPARR